jgi:hypothetical protein
MAAPLCPACGAALSGPVTACPRCGEPAAPPDDAEASALLSRANLLRLRGAVAEAVELCLEALRRRPGDAAACCLLGDLYAEQGRAEEARQCYRRALELRPELPAARARLARAEELLEARRRRAEWEAVISGNTPPAAARLLAREALLRVVAASGMVVCAIILALALLALATDDPRARVPLPPAPEPRRRVVPSETARERALLARTRELAGLSGAQVVRVEYDPATGAATLRALWVPPAGAVGDTLRIALLREGYRLARAAHLAEDSLPVVHVFLLAELPDATGRVDTQLLLRGALSRDNLLVEAERLSPAELYQRFEALMPPVLGYPAGG